MGAPTITHGGQLPTLARSGTFLVLLSADPVRIDADQIEIILKWELTAAVLIIIIPVLYPSYNALVCPCRQILTYTLILPYMVKIRADMRIYEQYAAVYSLPVTAHPVAPVQLLGAVFCPWYHVHRAHERDHFRNYLEMGADCCRADPVHIVANLLIVRLIHPKTID